MLTNLALAPTYLARFIEELVAFDPANLFRDRRLALAVLVMAVVLSTFALGAR